MTIKVSCPIQWALFWSLKYLHRNHHKKGIIVWDTHFYGPPNTKRMFFDYKLQKKIIAYTFLHVVSLHEYAYAYQ
jgi:hypothetical protein